VRNWLNVYKSLCHEIQFCVKEVYEEVHESMKQETSVRLRCSLVP